MGWNKKFYIHMYGTKILNRVNNECNEVYVEWNECIRAYEALMDDG